MASFTDLIANRIQQRLDEFQENVTSAPKNDLERGLLEGVRTHWHGLERIPLAGEHQEAHGSAAAVDGSQAVRALNTGADWIIAQALLIGPDGLRLFDAETFLLRGDILRPSIDRCAALLMRSLELGLALKYVQSGFGDLLLLDGSLYADLPHLLYPLDIPEYDDLPLIVLQAYLDLFDACQQRGVLLVGIAKSARSVVLGRAILDGHLAPVSVQPAGADGAEHTLRPAPTAAAGAPARRRKAKVGGDRLPRDSELLYRWTKGAGLTDPVLLGSTSFERYTAEVLSNPASLAEQFKSRLLSQVDHQRELERLRKAPAIGTVYLRPTAGDDALRVDALAGSFGRSNLRLLDFVHNWEPHTAALPLIRRLLGEYGGLNVYNAALYVVDREVRLHAETVDHIYLSVLRRFLDHPVQYDRSTRRFLR